LIAQLQGRILRKGPQEVVVDVGGVGYRVLIPVSTFYRLPDEDALALFGFLSAAEHELFERLIDVAGVGPKLAIAVLSGIEAPDLVDALRTSDVARLTRIPGVGRKTAERLILELKDKMPARTEPADTTTPEASGSSRDDLLSALVHLGYSRIEAERGVERALKEDGAGRFEDLLRRSLRALATR
jgi:holliday junction DNA helicase RuvA